MLAAMRLGGHWGGTSDKNIWRKLTYMVLPHGYTLSAWFLIKIYQKFPSTLPGNILPADLPESIANYVVTGAAPLRPSSEVFFRSLRVNRLIPFYLVMTAATVRYIYGCRLRCVLYFAARQGSNEVAAGDIGIKTKK